MEQPSGSTTELLQRASAGDRDAAGRLMSRLYDELRAIAGAAMKQERASHTLQPTALVHEAYVRLMGVDRTDWSDALHFRAMAAEMMRRVLIDHARRHRAAKRGGGRANISLDGIDEQPIDVRLDVLELDEALDALERLNPRHRRIVELRFFGGLTHEEAAKVLGISAQTARVDWSMARAWLRQRLDGQHR